MLAQPRAAPPAGWLDIPGTPYPFDHPGGWNSPHLDDFSLNPVLNDYRGPSNPGTTTRPSVRYFHDFASESIITK